MINKTPVLQLKTFTGKKVESIELAINVRLREGWVQVVSPINVTPVNNTNWSSALVYSIFYYVTIE